MMDSRVSQFLKSRKTEPAWVRPEARGITVKQCGREGPNVGFPPLTHDRIAVRNWAQSTCSHLPSQLAVLLVLLFLAGPRVCFIFGILATRTRAPADLSGQWQPSQVSFERTRRSGGSRQSPSRDFRFPN